MRFVASVYRIGKILARQFFQEFLLVHPVLEGLATINEDYRNFIGELTPQSVVGFHVNFTPVKTTSALQFRELFLHDFAEMTPFAGVHNHLAKE